MRRRLTISLDADDAGVRVDATSPERLDVAVRRVYADYAQSWPDGYQRQLAEIDRLVSGEEGSYVHEYDSMFQFGLIGRERGLPWQMVSVRVSVPCDFR